MVDTKESVKNGGTGAAKSGSSASANRTPQQVEPARERGLYLFRIRLQLFQLAPPAPLCGWHRASAPRDRLRVDLTWKRACVNFKPRQNGSP